MAQSHPARAYEEIVTFFAGVPRRTEIAAFRLSLESIACARHLQFKQSAGTLIDDEADELDQCVPLDRLLLLIRVKAMGPHRGARSAVSADTARLAHDRRTPLRSCTII